MRYRVAVLIPCYNEAVTIAKVVRDFHASLPEARICVFDNGSTDGTAELAREAGAEVHVELRRGKGNVVRRMFADVEADVYLLVDGDDTYDACSARAMVDLLIGDPSKARNVLGWAPEVDFARLVEMMVDNDVRVESARVGRP